MAPFLLLACMHRARVDSSHRDTGASSDADAAAHALLAANLDCALTPSMALDADALVAVIGFTLSTPNWLLTDEDAVWSAVQGKRLWERKQFTNADGEACSTYYRDAVEVSTECG